MRYSPTHRLMLFVMLILCLGAHVSTAHAQSRIEELVRAADLGTTTVGIFAINLTTGEELVRIAPDEPMIPASNMKLITTAVAMRVLGPDFVFKTDLLLLRPQGQDPILVVRGDGDPGFGDPELLSQNQLELEQFLLIWVDRIKQTGIRRFSRLVIDDRVFDQQFVHPSWPADQLNAWYCAQVGGINFNDNCIDVYVEPTRPGQSPRIKLSPEAPFIFNRTNNRAVTGDNDKFWVSRRMGTNDLTFWGKVKNRSRTPIYVTVNDPPMYFAQLLEHRLKNEGISVGEIGRPTLEDRLEDGQVLHRIQTTLSAVLHRTNKDSQNLFAEALFKRMGNRFTGQPGSWGNGSAAVRRTLTDMLGARSAIVAIEDGSGLSRNNRVTARVLVEILAQTFRDPRYSQMFLESLSVAGEDGTLKKRLNNTAGQIYGKSGYINGVSTLSGYIVVPINTGTNDNATSGPQHTVAFSLLFNNMPLAHRQRVRKLQEDILRQLEAETVNFEPAKLGG